MVKVCPKHGLEYNKRGQCPDCRSINQKRYDSSVKGKIAKRRHDTSEKRKYSVRARIQKWRTTIQGKLKHGAREAVRYAIRKGNLIKLPCQICGNPKSEAHHLFGYEKEHRLNVVFLCRSHHYQADHDPVFNETLKPDGLIV